MSLILSIQHAFSWHKCDFFWILEVFEWSSINQAWSELIAILFNNNSMFYVKRSFLDLFRITQNLEHFSYSIVKLMNRDVTIMNTGWTMVSSLLMNSQEIKGGKRIELHCWWTNDLLNEEKERLNKCTQPAMKLIGLRLVVWWHENRKVTLRKSANFANAAGNLSPNDNHKR